MTTEMEWGATIEDLLNEVGITEEELNDEALYGPLFYARGVGARANAFFQYTTVIEFCQ